MVRPIVVLGQQGPTGWFDINRLGAEGPYEEVSFSSGDRRYVPTEGPLRGTSVDGTPLWCAILEGKLIIAPRTQPEPPPPLVSGMQIRGSYQFDTASGNMLWAPIGNAWDDNEIDQYRALSNPAHRVYSMVSPRPAHVFLFGAGASYGSDARYLYQQGRLPPLGKDLFAWLEKDRDLRYWHSLPEAALQVFRERPFEDAMNVLDAAGSWSYDLDVEMSLFFSKFRPQPSNLYWKLAKRISRRIKTGWTGAAITLNYERLLEESFMRNRVFTSVKGVTYYDDDLPPLPQDQLFEVCYPHGACQFFFSQNSFGPDLKVAFGESGHMGGNTGANHILKHANIGEACRLRQIPLICRYQSSKRPSLSNYFLDTQRARARELILGAETVTVIGVQCTYPDDIHLWGPLGETDATVMYIEPDTGSPERFQAWASDYHKSEGEHVRVVRKKFKEAFETILQFNCLGAR